jgi:transketolase
MINQKPSEIYSDMRDAFFEELYLIAKKDKDVILLIGDQGAQSLEKFCKEMPSQIINAGVAEQNIISTAAGLALGGKKVFVHSISSFITLRCYEQIKIDIGLMNLPVTIVGIGAGFAYGNAGPTHHSDQDIAVMKAIPGITILNASDTVSLSVFPHLVYENPCPNYIRFDKGNFPPLYNLDHDFNEGIAKIKSGKDVIIISTGIMVHKALEISSQLKSHNIEAGVIDLYRIKPVNKDLLMDFLKTSKNIITIEEHLSYGGIGSIISDFLCDHNLSSGFKRFGLADDYCFDYGDRNYMHKKTRLDTESIINEILKWLNTD